MYRYGSLVSVILTTVLSNLATKGITTWMAPPFSEWQNRMLSATSVALVCFLVQWHEPLILEDLKCVASCGGQHPRPQGVFRPTVLAAQII